MALRNLSPQVMFRRLAEAHPSLFAFDARERSFADWKAEVKPRVLATLGDFPAKVPAEPELVAEWDENGIFHQRWLIEVGEFIAATVAVAYPGRPESRKRPAILCCHGHGPFGKEPVMGNTSSPDLRAAIEAHNYDYGRQMAAAGFVTYAIDWMGFGERNDSRKPNHFSNGAGRDWCNLIYLNATMLGMTSLSMNVAQGMAATDFVAGLPGVDPDRLGVMGLSGGGTMCLWSAFCDPRFKAAEIICYSDLWSNFGFRDFNYCGMQVAPGLFKLVDLPDLQGLLAPLPLLVDIGAHDTCFNVDGAMKCYRKLERIYRAAGAAEQLELDFFPGEHGWGGNKSKAFFGKYL